ncbi:hypothetical protein GKE82_13065 [Conexibacter sp. W3-3-2]|nr:hypothetical protein [Conexibacter sp. W3-3-2]
MPCGDRRNSRADWRLEPSPVTRPRSRILAVLALLAALPAVAFATGIEGTPRDDLLRGSQQADTLTGLEGDDELRAFDGDDTLDGGPGDDRLLAGRGADTLLGGPGADRLTAGPGRDVLRGGPGSDVLNARDGEPDTIHCGPGGRDRATLDLVDVIADATPQRPDGACELVDRAPPKTG